MLLLRFGVEKWWIVAEHRRSFGRGETVYDPWHYVPAPAHKPGCSAASPIIATSSKPATRAGASRASPERCLMTGIS
jgi:hypothetical protein